MLSQALKDECQAELERCHAIAVAAYPEANIPLPRMVYTQRGQVAGVYNHQKCLIKINPILLAENVREMVDNTVSHEFAHCADITVHGIQYGAYNPRSGRQKRIVHGHTFKAFQRLFGRSTSTTHRMDTSNAKVRTSRSTREHVWVCGCGEGKVTLTPYKHARMLQVAHTGYGVYMRGHTPKRCGVYTYQENGSTPQKPKLDPIPVTPVIAAAARGPIVVAEQGQPKQSNKELAIKIFGLFPQRGEFIRKMVMLGVKKTTASTYHHNVKSGKWS